MNKHINIANGGFLPYQPDTQASAVPHVPTLDAGKTPAEWVRILHDKGLILSERTLREKAHKLGACIKLSYSILITPEHMEAILKDGDKCRSNSTSGKQSYYITLWSQQEDRIIRSATLRGTELEAKQALGEFWNCSPGVTAEPGRYRADLMVQGTTTVIMTIG